MVTADIVLNPDFFVGRTAGELRAVGVEIPANIPDCAVSRSFKGKWAFDWFKLEFTILKKEEAES